MIKLLRPATALLLATPTLAQTIPATTPPATTPSAPHFEPAPMQPEPTPPAIRGVTLEQLVATPAWQEPVIATAKTQFNQMPGACAAARYQPTSELTVFQPAQFGADGKPFAGIWTEPVSVTGCGAGRTLNVLTIARAEGAPQRVALMPGNSHADPVTQKAALQYAQAIAGRAPPPNCRQQAFTEARFQKYDGAPNPEVTDGRDARPWDEDWMVFACGTTYSINIRFQPNAKGTQLAASNPVRLH